MIEKLIVFRASQANIEAREIRKLSDLSGFTFLYFNNQTKFNKYHAALTKFTLPVLAVVLLFLAVAVQVARPGAQLVDRKAIYSDLANSKQATLKEKNKQFNHYIGQGKFLAYKGS